jgi:uncharacterized protein
MFGLPSLQKLLLLAGLILAVWYAFKIVGHLQRQRRESERRSARAGSATKPTSTGGGAIEDTVKCPSCGVYQTTHRTRACERADCPFRAS